LRGGVSFGCSQGQRYGAWRNGEPRRGSRSPGLSIESARRGGSRQVVGATSPGDGRGPSDADLCIGTEDITTLAEKRACDYFERSKAGVKAVFNVTAMERSILVELFERGGRGQLSGLRDRRPIERLVNKGFVERHTLNSQQEEYVLTAIGKKVLDNK
jgi:hypothetical protein